MANAFTLGGATIYAPGVLVRSTIGANRVLQLLPFGTIMFAGASDGGVGEGNVYTFFSYADAQRVLRGGALLDAINDAIDGGGASQFIAVVLGTKTSAVLDLAGASSAAAVVTAGDQGAWTNGIEVAVVAGTTMDTFALIVTYVDALGNTNVIGGPGTDLDNFTLFSEMASAIAANAVLTPNDGVTPPIIVLTVTTDGAPVLHALAPLAGGTGNGAYTPLFADVQAGLESLVDVAFDIGHLVGVYDLPSQAYFDEFCASNEPFGRLQRQVAQCVPTGVSPTYTKAVNSAAVRAYGVARAAAIDSKRTSVMAQRIYKLNKATGVYGYRDMAPTICGIAAGVGATGAWGPATPLTYEILPNTTNVDYPILDQTGDRDAAVRGGLFALERIGAGVSTQARIIQSVTTFQTTPGGSQNDWAEFSIVRVSDALLANMKAAAESAAPKAIGGGNDIKTMNGILADCQDVLELGIDQRWVTGYDPASVQITIEESDGDLLTYSAAPTRPLNHLGIDGTMLPYQATVALSSSSASSGG